MCRIFYLISIITILTSDLPAQTFQSVMTAGGLGNDVGQNIEVDQDGNMFLSGFFSETAWFDSFPLTSNGCYDNYLVKLNSEWEVLWAKSFGADNCDYSGGLCIDNEQNVYVSGKFQIEMNIGDTVLYSDGSQDAFIAKFDNDGNSIWTKKLSGPGSESSGDLKHKDGSIYMSGSFSDTASIDTMNIISSGGADSYLLKLNTSGDIIWIKQGGGTGFDVGSSMDVDELGNIYLSGKYHNTAIFGDFVTTSVGSQDIFICKYNEDGIEQWLKGFGSSGLDFSGNLTVDGDGNFYFAVGSNNNFTIDMLNISLTSNDALLLLKFNTDGVVQWVRQDECADGCSWGQIVIDDYDNIFLNGIFTNQLIIDGDTIVASEPYNYKAIFAQMDNNGNLQWFKNSSMGSCGPSGMKSLNDSTLIIVGSFDYTVDLDDLTITYSGSDGGFLGSKDIFLTTLSKGDDINLSIASDSSIPIEYQLYPNPAKHSVTLQFKDSDEKTLLLFSPTGSLLFMEIFYTDVVTIDMTSFTKGLYVLQVQSQNYQKVAKIIKE